MPSGAEIKARAVCAVRSVSGTETCPQNPRADKRLLIALIRRKGHVPVPGTGTGPGGAVV